MKSDTIIISIHPVFVDKILSGEKQFEFRKRFPENIRYMLIYTTSPVKKITALAEIDYIIMGAPANVWKKTRKTSGVTKSFFDMYFSGRKNAYAVKIKKVFKFNNPLNINDIDRISTAPQSYTYLNNNAKSIVLTHINEKVSNCL